MENNIKTKNNPYKIMQHTHLFLQGVNFSSIKSLCTHNHAHITNPGVIFKMAASENKGAFSTTTTTTTITFTRVFTKENKKIKQETRNENCISIVSGVINKGNTDIIALHWCTGDCNVLWCISLNVCVCGSWDGEDDETFRSVTNLSSYWSPVGASRLHFASCWCWLLLLLLLLLCYYISEQNRERRRQDR